MNDKPPTAPLPAKPKAGDQPQPLSKGAISVQVFRIAMWMGMVFSFLFVVPEFQKMFEEFGIELPSITRLLLSLCKRGQAVFITLLMVVAAVETAALMIPNASGRKWARRLSWIGLFLCLAFFVAAIFMPLSSIISGLNGG